MSQQSHVRGKVLCIAVSLLVLAAFLLCGCAGPQTAAPSPSPPALPTTSVRPSLTQAPTTQNTPVPTIAPSAAPAVSSPTGRPAVLHSATPTVVTATPVPKLALQLLAVAPIDLGLLFDSWSPDGQWVAYWVVDSEAGAEHPVFVNVIEGTRCQHEEVVAESWDGRVVWQEDGRVTAVLNQQGEAVKGPACGTFASVTDSGLPGRGVTEQVSPDGRYRAETRLVRTEGEGGQYKSLTIADVATGQTIATVSYVTSADYGWAGQGWLNDELYLVGVAIDQGVLYVSVPGGRIGHVLPDFFGLDVADEEYVSRVDLQNDPAAGVYHLLIQIYKSSPASPPLLYHSELDQVEQLAFYFAWPWYNSSSFTPDGQWLLLGNPVEAGTPGPYADYWLRSVDPPGSTAIHLVRGAKFEGVSDQARAMAEIWADAALGQWALCGLSRPAQEVAFCRDNSVRIFALPTGTLLGQQSAAPYDVSTVSWSPDGSQWVAGGFDQQTGKQALFVLEAPPITPACVDDGTVLFTVPVGPDGVQYGGEQSGPMALAIATDGTFWIADTQGNRLLHYDPQGALLNRIDLNSYGIGVADVEATGSDVLALLVGYGEKVLRFTADGNLLATYDIPEGLGPEGGLTGLALGDLGEVLLEFEMGAEVVQLVDARGVLKPAPLSGYTHKGQLYKPQLAGWQASHGSITIGSNRIEVTVPNILAGMRILGFTPAGGFYVMVDEMVSAPTVWVDQTVRLYGPAGELFGVARVPLAERYTYVQNGLAIGPDGRVYALLTRPDQVEIVSLGFSAELEPILPTPIAASMPSAPASLSPIRSPASTASPTPAGTPPPFWHRIVFGYNHEGATELWTVDPTTGEARRQIRPEQQVQHPALSASGETIAYVNVTGDYGGVPSELWLMDRDGAKPRPLYAPPPGQVNGLAWTADGAHLVYSVDGHSRQSGVWRTGLDGGPPQRLFAWQEGEWAAVIGPWFEPGSASRPERLPTRYPSLSIPDEPTDTPTPEPTATVHSTPTPVPTQRQGEILSRGVLDCTPLDGYSRCVDEILGIEFEHPSSWGQIEARLRTGMEAGYAYDYEFGGELYGDTFPLGAGGRSADFSEPRGAMPTDFTGYGEGGLHWKASACDPRWIDLFPICAKVTSDLAWMIRFPDASFVCQGGSDIYSLPVFRIEVNLPDHPTINGFVFEAPFVSDQFADRIDKELYPLLGLTSDMVPRQCDQESQQAFDAQLAVLLKELTTRTADDETVGKLDELIHLATSIVPRQSAGGPVLLFARDDDLWRVDVHGEEPTRLTQGGVLDWGQGQDPGWTIEAQERRPQVSPDGRRLVGAGSDLQLVLVDVASGTQTSLAGPGAFEVAWSPSSQAFAYAPQSRTDRVDLRLYDVRRGQADTLLSVERTAGLGIHDIVWSPDNRLIAFGCCFVASDSEVYTGTLQGEIRVVEVATGEVQTVGRTEAHVASNSQLCWTADGQVVTSPDEGVRCSYSPPLPNVLSPDGLRRAVLGPLSPDDEAWTGPSRLTIRGAPTDEVLWEREIRVGAVKMVAWSPDGRYLFLDDDEPDSPVWRIAADGTGDLQEIVADGFLLGAVPQWQRWSGSSIPDY